MRSRRLFSHAAAVFLLLLSAGASLAAGPPAGSAPNGTDNAVAPLPAADNVPLVFPSAPDNAAGAVPVAADNTAGTVPAADNGWVDRTHTRIERDLFEATVWFDRFFGGNRIVVTEPPESFLRWMSELRWDEEENFSGRSTVRASLRLPRLKKRWKLAISGETRGDPIALTAEDPGNPGLDLGSRVRTGSTELIYDIYRTTRSSLDVGAGVRVKIPPDAFVRTRFQHARPVGFNTLGRFTAIAYWNARNGFGESNQIDLERWLTQPTLLRWSNTFTIEEKTDGWLWGTELSLLHKISPKSAITFAGGASGTTHPAWIALDYRILTRYRRNVWRKWLFLEGEPYVHWPRKVDGSRDAVWGATLRVEILFTGMGPHPQAEKAIGP